MNILKIPFFIIPLAIVFTSCTQNDSKRLTSQDWEVEKVTVDMQEKYMREDTFLSSEIKSSYMGRIYKFKDNGTFTVIPAGKHFTGKWNFAKQDTSLLYHDIGFEGFNLLTMRSSENSTEETWMPIVGSSIFEKNPLKMMRERILVFLVPTPVEGAAVYLYLTSKTK